MKWFKHISDSLDDPFIFDLIKKFGPSGYLIFFGILEIYAREYKPDLEWNLDVSLTYLRSKLNLTRFQLMTNCLSYINDEMKWIVKINCERVSIKIPKFHEMIDEYTNKKNKRIANDVGTMSGHSPEKRRLELELDKDKDKPPKSPSLIFDKFWSSYPKKKSKGQAEKAWLKINPDEQLLAIMIATIERAKTSDEWTKDGGKFIPYPATWLNAKGWEDEFEEKQTKDPYDGLERV